MPRSATATPAPRRAKRPGAPSRWRRVVSVRRAVQIGVGVALFAVVQWFDVPLGWVILGASAAGIVFGKFFCRWMCPLGALMETMLAAGGQDRQKSLYMYFKLGCPIAWAGGLLNKLSLFRVKLRPERCTDCGKCDTTCYVASLSEGASLHVVGQTNPSTHYSCSRCLDCVASCPTGALTVGIGGRER